MILVVLRARLDATKLKTSIQFLHVFSWTACATSLLARLQYFGQAQAKCRRGKLEQEMDQESTKAPFFSAHHEHGLEQPERQPKQLIQ